MVILSLFNSFMSQPTKTERIAYLGPRGTYSYLALTRMGYGANAIPCSSIAEVMRCVAAGEVHYGIVPLENVKQGPVTETWDLLLQYRDQIFITGSYLLPIEHALGMLPGRFAQLQNRLDQIPAVFSRDQALQQCAHFLSSRMPQTSSHEVNSTVAAIDLVQSQQNNAAVIAAKETLLEYGMEVVAEGISGEVVNKTRFAIVNNVSAARIKETQPAIECAGNCVTSIGIDPKKDRQGILYDLLQVISVRHKINMLSIHSRPNTLGGFVFFLDLEGSLASPQLVNCLADLKDYCKNITGDLAEISVFGSYQREEFRPMPFKSIGIIGGHGIMGRWFHKFFTDLGFATVIVDRDTSVGFAEFCAQTDVIVLSLPMTQTVGVFKQLVPYLRPHHLVVENCSIKDCILPPLLGLLPPEVELLGMHTMFKGDINDLKGESIVITQTDKSGDKALALEDLFYKHGAHIFHADIDQHDRGTAFTQSLINLLLLLIAETMTQKYGNYDEVIPFNTRTSRQVFALIKRVLQQNEELIRDMQMLNKHSVEFRKAFITTANKFVSALESGDYEMLLASLKNSRRFFDSHLETNS